MLGCLEEPELFERVSSAFQAYSAGRTIVPPPGELIFSEPPGESHIKFGAIEGCPIFVVKVASSFARNTEQGLSSSQGVMLALERETGRLSAVLLDEGLLTDVRTAVAGALCARVLAPREVRRIGIIGTGIQARLQLRYLKAVTPCREVMVWGRNPERVENFHSEMEQEGFSIRVARTVESLARECRLIVTTTPATSPILLNAQVQPGTHITAIGADTPDKQELESELFFRADRVVTDSRAHCVLRGDISVALRKGLLKMEKVCELGEILGGKAAGRGSENEITVADLTGLAVQDIAIAQFIVERVH